MVEPTTWAYALISVIIISLISLIGIVSFGIKKQKLNTILLSLVSFSTGSLFGGAFLHLLPEASEDGFSINIALFALSGLVGFFVIEKFIHWRHCHIPTSKEHPHPFAYMNLFGDSLHNFIDGLVIAGAYIASIPLGLSTSIAVIFHEIPQEIGDFGVLLHGGFSKKKALLLNLLSASTALLGTIIGLIFGGLFEGFNTFIIPFTAGGFIYIAGSDLIPELHKECEVKESASQLLWMILGVAVMFLFLLIE